MNQMSRLVQDRDIIFNLAGSVSHEDSMRHPMSDLELNCHAPASLLEVCRHHNPRVQLVYTSTRQVYGQPHRLPVDESEQLAVDVNGINKIASEQYHLLYHRVHGMWTTILRLTNTYGPRQLIRHARQGFMAWFIHQALLGETIQVYGNGLQLRDITFVDDAVDALLLAASCEAANGEIFNLGGQQTSLLDAAKLLSALAPPTTFKTVPFPDERQRIDIGSYVADWRKARTMLGGRPALRLNQAYNGRLTTTGGLAITMTKSEPTKREYIAVANPARSYEALNQEIDAAIAGVFRRGQFVLGEEVAAFEREFANYVSCGFAVGVASGTDALRVALLSLEIGPGDEVITVANAGDPTPIAIWSVGAIPRFVNVDPRTYTMAVEQVEDLLGPQTRALLPVHLYGQPADSEPLRQLASAARIRLIEDACQAHGASYQGQMVGTFGDFGCFSFYPTKNLGAFGDGGMVVTNNEQLATRARMIREYGWQPRGRSLIKGINSRLDELQAAILRVKLPHLHRANARRREIASYYQQHLATISDVVQQDITLPSNVIGRESSNHIYVIRTPWRDALRQQLTARGSGRVSIIRIRHINNPPLLRLE